MKKDNCILSIAGHDPSGGAGITSDIKTFASNGLYGLSVCTAITVQNDVDFKQCAWVDKDIILSQLETLFERFKISVVKIGIIESWQVLSVILDTLHRLNSEIKIILDPIFKASAGFDFHAKESQNLLDKIFKQCFIVTPNYEEIKSLYPSMEIEDTLEHISSLTNVYLKGGHREEKKGWDALYYNKIVQINIEPKSKTIFQKHGSGCVLSSALASNLALGEELEDASRNAKYYTEQFLNSNESLLGVHYYSSSKYKELSNKQRSQNIK